MLKPCWGGSGVAVGLTSLDTIERDVATALEEGPGRPWLVQAFLPSIAADGETSFVFGAGQFTRAVRTQPAASDFRVNVRYTPRPPERTDPPPAEAVADTARVLAALPGGRAPLYARIDGAPGRDGRRVCLEAEVNDPTLFLDLAPTTAELLARSTLAAVMEQYGALLPRHRAFTVRAVACLSSVAAAVPSQRASGPMDAGPYTWLCRPALSHAITSAALWLGGKTG